MKCRYDTHTNGNTRTHITTTGPTMIFNSFLPELVHEQLGEKYQLLSGSTHKQQLNFHLTRVQLHVQNYPF